MKSLRTVGLCLAATVAVGAGTAASASAALPEFTGPFSKTFTSTIKGTLLETVGGAKLQCKAGTDTGELVGPQNGTMTMVFTGCQLKKVPCNTPGAGAGVIVTSLLFMKIYYISKPKKQVGIDLIPGGGEPVMTFACGSAMRGVVIGSVIGRITPINKLVTPPQTFVLSFTQTLGVQKVTKLESQPIDVLETSFGGPFEGTGLSSNDVILFGEPVTLIA